VIGEPTDLSDARQLAQEDRYQFQWWHYRLVKARPVGSSETETQERQEGQRPGDRRDHSVYGGCQRQLKRVLVQVKSGHVKSGDNP